MLPCIFACLQEVSEERKTCTAPHSLKKTLRRTLYSVPHHSQLIWKGTVNVFLYKGKRILFLPKKQCQTRTVWIIGFATVLAVTIVVSNWFALMLMPFCSEPTIHCQGECYYHLSLPLMVQGNNFMYSVLRSLFSLNMICVFCSWTNIHIIIRRVAPIHTYHEERLENRKRCEVWAWWLSLNPRTSDTDTWSCYDVWRAHLQFPSYCVITCQAASTQCSTEELMSKEAANPWDRAQVAALLPWDERGRSSCGQFY